ncbi:GNAT family N-acetyltransferase [Novosphingobium sp. PS1R-30]|uniref:GNAT family N-acetyltransferase n=1 Tax=Novosphingobium anseongense TaxID=3133436 RepID=A0ABU8RZJ1_9SPHN|nr:MAG: N-acetyltransferase [Novosphingobium sp.]
MRALPAGYVLVDDRDRIDAVAAHAYLTRSYWAEGIPLETVARSIAGSLCVAIQSDGRQVAFARIISDYATFAYLADVHVIEEHRGQGLSHVMVEHFLAHPRLQGLRRWALFTLDAHGLYEQYDFSRYPHPERVMTRDDPDVYR